MIENAHIFSSTSRTERDTGSEGSIQLGVVFIVSPRYFFQ